MIRHDTALRLGCKIKHSSQSAHQADGSSPLTIVGETTISLARKYNTFQFCGLVVQNLDVEMLAGTLFMEINDITIRPANELSPSQMAQLTHMVQHRGLSTDMPSVGPTYCEDHQPAPLCGQVTS